ncbi:unnamed protein product [Calicophoron daubneyi]|uniref:adenylate cyclase n=1 Tax=Calicophoron daubneyi TaxID=300641 RepID=A0AAV2TM10_CALDB
MRNYASSMRKSVFSSLPNGSEYDVFESNAKGLTILRRVLTALRYAIRTLNSQSVLFTEYVRDITLWETKLNFRITLFLCLYCIVVHVIEGALFAPVPAPFPSALVFVMPRVHQTSSNYWVDEIDDDTHQIPWSQFDVFRRYKTLTQGNMQTALEVFSDCVMLCLVSMMSVYVAFWNKLKRSFGFYLVGENIRARTDAAQALKSKVCWIEAVMPSQVTADYHKLQRRHEDLGDELWIYTKDFDPVSILFADIVGFTKMSCNKTALQVVQLLNDLYSRFDELCKLTRCEKMGTLGDCYYCVAGCPEPRPDHAVACVEMGLGMCRIIKAFNCDHSENVGMRVGVHSGRVNAAIIGAQRFRYDIYSYDVIVANALESTGRTGRVHISETTYAEIKTMYNVSVGQDLEVKSEEQLGISGMVLERKFIKTYFVDPRSSVFRRKHEKFGQQKELRSVNFEEGLLNIRASRFREVRRLATYSTSTSIRTYLAQGQDLRTLERDIELIHNIQKDPKGQVDLFRAPPLTSFLLQFIDPETEWHYQNHHIHYVRPTYINSLKVGILVDGITVFLVTVLILLIVIAVHIHATEMKLENVRDYTLYLLTALVTSVALIFPAIFYADQIENKHFRQIHNTLSHKLVQELCTGIQTLTPTLIFLEFTSSLGTSSLFGHYLSVISKIEGVCILVHMLPVCSAAWGRFIFCTVSLVAIGARATNKFEDEYTFCILSTDNQTGVPMHSINVVSLWEVLCCYWLVIRLTRGNERGSRLCFYVNRECEISSDISDIAVREAQELLFNIIPEYVYSEILETDQFDVEGKFSYAVNLQNVGVVFASIANFFSAYYREDYKGGASSLKLLNKIICLFDELLKRRDMKDIEKIKTINDCYMAAAGLNANEVSRNFQRKQHLISLMEFCHLLKETVDNFNKMYIFGTDKFIIKIGYNFGPVTAGIIGTTKPMYDIWGDTVNVASRMYSTGIPGEIQVPEYVISVLEDYFNFEYRGEIFVKGKGDMKTYICNKK